MRMFITLLLLHLATHPTRTTTQNIDTVQTSSTILSTKLPSRKNHGRTIERLIGGHLLFNRDVYRHIRNNLKNVNDSSGVAVFSHGKNIYLTENNYIDDSISLDTASAGNGNDDQKTTNYTKKEESKKTLADQVAEGKYGLIDKELFQTQPKRPGVLSYKPNAEVPKDDAKNYGGLKDDEIWLSENHLLVLKGGVVNRNNNKPKWKPIDDYEAPTRQVKLPLNPRIPPPFPVQLTDDGPLQFIGNNKLPVYNPFTNQTVFLYSNERVPDIKADDLNKKNTPTGNGKDNAPAKFNGYQYPPPAPLPLGKPNQTFSNPFLNLPPLPPFPFPPPTGSFDEQNSTDVDEDDPSLYYPPPYSFEYKNNYSSAVSPGPLVPGIILPPPPNFFGVLEENDRPIKTPLDVLNKINDIKLRERLKNKTSSVPIEATSTSARMELTTTTLNPLKSKPIRIETPNYNIEIEKANVKTFPLNNTTMLKTVRPTVKSQVPPGTTYPTKKRTRTKAPPVTRTQLHKVNIPVSPPLISLNQQNAKGNPIYFEYFDARTPGLHPFEDYSLTTPVPFVTTIANDKYNRYSTTTIKAPINQPPPPSKKRPPSKTYLPSKNKDISFVAPDLEHYRYKTMQEFNREIETIRQTLRFYENSVPLISNLRAPKARPIYDFSFDLTQVRAPVASPIQSSYHSTIPVTQVPVTYNQAPIPSQQVNHDYRPTTPGVSKHYYGNPPVPISNNQQLKSRPPVYDKPDQYNGYNYRNPSINVEITSANPHLDYSSYTTAKPVYFDQPNWFTIEKVKVHEIPKPLIYNNGASGYNQKLYLPSKHPFQPNSEFTKANSNPSNQPYHINTSTRQSSGVRQKVKTFLQNPQQKAEPYLEKDILVNYKHPLPAINPDSEILPYNGRNTKPFIEYRLPDDKAHVYFITPQDLKYT